MAGIEPDAYTSAPHQMTRTTTLGASPPEVFAALADYAAMPGWFPGMSAVTVDGAQAQVAGGVGTIRVCQFSPEQQLTEDIVVFERPCALAYTIRDGNFMGLSDHFALIILEQAGDGSLLSWHQYFNHPDPARFVAQGGAMLDGAFDNLRQKFGAR